MKTLKEKIEGLFRNGGMSSSTFIDDLMQVINSHAALEHPSQVEGGDLLSLINYAIWDHEDNATWNNGDEKGQALDLLAKNISVVAQSHAEQEATAFNDWCYKEGWSRISLERWCKVMDNNYHTTTELYHLFKADTAK